MTVPLESVPGIPALALAHATGGAGAAPFLGEPATAAAIAARAERVLAAFRPREGADETLSELARGRRAGVLAGQQVGLLTGPLLTTVKALAAVQIARELSSRGTDLAPVFWCASEDHDLVEVTRISLPGADGAVEAGPDPAPLAGNRRPVGALPVETVVAAVLDRAREGAGAIADAESLAALGAAHAGATFREAFVASLSWLLDEPGLLFADAARREDKPALVPLATRLANLRQVIGILQNRNPGVTVLLAQIIPTDNWYRNEKQVDPYNAALPALAADASTGTSRVLIVDQNGGFDGVADTSADGIHPNAEGMQKIASTAPAAPSRWPTEDLVDDMVSSAVRLPMRRSP